MPSPIDNPGDWFRWAVSLLIAAIFGAMRVLWTRDVAIQVSIDELRKASDERNSKELGAVWEEVSKLRDLFGRELTTMRSGMDQDRKEAWEMRTKIAADMITKADLREQLDRLGTQLSNQAVRFADRARGDRST